MLDYDWVIVVYFYTKFVTDLPPTFLVIPFGFCCLTIPLASSFNTLMPGTNGRQFPDDNFRCIFSKEIMALFPDADMSHSASVD